MFATLERHSNFSICLEKSLPDHPTLIISRNDGNSKLTLAENYAKASYELLILFYGTYLLCSQMVPKVITGTVELVLDLLEEVQFLLSLRERQWFVREDASSVLRRN